jgi:glycosyltransferase involved in cell wall biosynthesis
MAALQVNLSDAKSDRTAPRHILVAAHAWYGDVIGGSFRLASEFAEFLAEQGHYVTYVCCAPSSDRTIDERECSRGVHVCRYFPAPHRSSGIGRLRHHVAQSARLVKKLICDRPVNAISGHSPLQFLGATRAMSHSSAFKNYTVHSPFDDELLSNALVEKQKVRHRLAGRIARWIDGRNVRIADRVQTASRYTLDVMTAKHGSAVREKGVVAPGWVDAELFRPMDDRRRVRQELGAAWATNLPVFFTLRRLEARMGLETLIGAAQRLKAEGHDFRVLIGGSGSLRNDLLREIYDSGVGENVFLIGRLPEEDLPRCYAAADCFVLPTRALECFGLIVLESFAAGTPVIASRTAAIPELAARQGENWMFEPGNADELANRMKRFIKGELKPDLDFREMVREYDRPVVLARWAELLTGSPEA